MATKLLGLSVNLSPDFFKDLKRLLSLNGEEIKKLAPYTKTERGFKVPEEKVHEIFKELKS